MLNFMKDEAAYTLGEAKLRGTGRTVPPLSSLKQPLRDGDTERPDDPVYAVCWFMNANSASADAPARMGTNAWIFTETDFCFDSAFCFMV